MKRISSGLKSKSFCPKCSSDAVYLYGRDRRGRQRLMCILCERQFVPGHVRALVDKRPACPNCGKSMHLYRREGEVVRFRCSAYPGCRSYIKFTAQEVIQRGFLRA